MLQFRFQRVSSLMSFLTTGGTLSRLGLSPMSFITEPAFSTMRGGISLIVED
jgi:hypothetical protein